MQYGSVLLVTVLSLAAQSAAYSAPTVRTSPFSSLYDQCMARANSTPEERSCAQEEFQRADAALNAAYKKIGKDIGAERAPDLLKAERAWLQYRDAECGFQASAVRGGTAYPLYEQDCRILQTYRRTQELKADALP